MLYLWLHYIFYLIVGKLDFQIFSFLIYHFIKLYGLSHHVLKKRIQIKILLIKAYYFIFISTCTQCRRQPEFPENINNRIRRHVRTCYHMMNHSPVYTIALNLCVIKRQLHITVFFLPYLTVGRIHIPIFFPENIFRQPKHFFKYIALADTVNRFADGILSAAILFQLAVNNFPHRIP